MIPLARRSPRRPAFEQQALQGLHRIRSLWMSTRTARINALRGFCREFGLAVPQWARTGIEAISHVLADPISPVPLLVRHSMKLIIEEIRLLAAHRRAGERTAGRTHTTDADNLSGCFMPAACSDWRSAGRFHVGTDHRKSTHDAGYTTACTSPTATKIDQLLGISGESI
jgi:hypothetical protein